MQAESSTFKPALMLMSGRAIAFSVTFFIPMLLVRLFTPAEFGTYKQFFLITYTLYAIGQFGLAECLYYFLPANPSQAGRYVCNSMLTLGTSGLLCFTALAVSPDRIARWMNNPALGQYIPIIGASLVFMLIGAVLEIAMVCRKRYRWATVTYVASDVVRALALIVPALVSRSIESVLLGVLIFCAIRAVSAFCFSRIEFGREMSFDRRILRQQLGYALPFGLYVLADFATVNYHQYAVTYFFDTATFAIYAVGCMQIPLVDFMAGPAANVMMVRMGEELREGRPSCLLAIWHDTTRKLALVFFPIVALLAVNAHALITTMFTGSYSRSVPIFTVWSLLVLGAAFQTDGAMRVFAQTRFLFGINMVRLATTALLINWFIATFHLIGAVLITLIGVALGKTLALLRLRVLMKVGLGRLLPWRNLGGIFLAAAIAALPVALLNTHARIPSLYLLPMSGAAYLALYSVLVLSCGLLTQEERQTIGKRVFRPIRLLMARG